MTQRREEVPESSDDGSPYTLPVIEDRVSVRTQRVETGRVRVITQEHEERREIDKELESRRVRVERVPRDEVLAERPEPRWEGDALVFPVAEEILVVETRWRLREEVYVREQREVRTEKIPVTLSRRDVVIERTLSEGQREPGGEP